MANLAKTSKRMDMKEDLMRLDPLNKSSFEFKNDIATIVPRSSSLTKELSDLRISTISAKIPKIDVRNHIEIGPSSLYMEKSKEASLTRFHQMQNMKENNWINAVPKNVENSKIIHINKFEKKVQKQMMRSTF